ncbi:MAG: hypothetical protein RML35_05405 [Chloroherpetonaceae bacterium]|nr:hypothetical protein [Chloroherpetonaceae bacterium]
MNIVCAVPSGFSIRPVILRGANRTLEILSGSPPSPVGIDVPVVPGGGTGPLIDRDTATITAGNTVTFGYSRFAANTEYTLRLRDVSLSGDDETPRVTGTAVRGNLSSTLPGDFGAEQNSFALLDPNGEYTLTRTFRTVAPADVPPIQILSYPTGTSVPTDTVIRIRFSRPITVGTASTNQLRPADLERIDPATFAASRIRIRRGSGAAAPPTATANLGGPSAVNDFSVSGATIGTAIADGLIGYRATLEEGGTVLAIRRLERPAFLGGGTIPFESGTTYTVDLAMPGSCTGYWYEALCQQRIGLPTGVCAVQVPNRKGYSGNWADR